MLLEENDELKSWTMGKYSFLMLLTKDLDTNVVKY